MVPGALAYTWLGDAGRQALTAGENLMRDVLIAIGVFASAALLLRLVRRFRGQPSFIESAELLRRLEQAPETVIIDVRTREEFAGPLGHILGARHIPIGELSTSLQSKEEMKRTPIVLVCKTDKRSANGAALLRDMGFEQVSVLRGGMENWKHSGYPVESQPPS
jgi:rhodanese-related sulfurtransferase